MSQSVVTLKEEGNKHFKGGNYDEALSLYTQALHLGDIKDTDKSVIYKNRAMCNLKLENFDKAVADATESLEIMPNDPKALYRRCVAYEKLDRLEDAYKDAVLLLKVESTNVAVKPILARLTPIIRERVRLQNSSQEKVNQMFKIVFDKEAEKAKRTQAANNLVVLAREDGGPELIVRQGGMAKLKNLMMAEKDMDILQGGARTISCLTLDSRSRSQTIYEDLGILRLGQLMAMPCDGLSTSIALVLYNMLMSITEFSVYKAELDIYEEKRRNRDPAIHPKFLLDEYQQKFVDEVFMGLIKMLQHLKVSACGRDAAMELMIKTMKRKTAMHWTRKFLDTSGVEGLLLIAGSVKQHDVIPVTDQSRMHASLLLNTIWEDLIGDKENHLFKDKVSEVFNELFGNEDMDSKVEAVRAVSMLLQGPYEIGNMIVGFQGVTEVMLALAQSDRPLHQQVAVEAIVHSASKKDKCTGLLGDAVPILKKLYHEGVEDGIKVRALVGLCKLGSFEGSDAASRPMADGSTVTLAKACRKFLANSGNDMDMKQWATEGLAYLTLDADVKEELVNDPKALTAVVQAAQTPSTSLMYAAAILFVNLTNSQDKQDIAPEMVELAKYAKQHVPEEHPKDKEEFVNERIKKLVAAGMLMCMSALAKTESKMTREQVARVLLTVACNEAYRGQIVQCGGAKLLINLSLENNTDLGKGAAAQTLAKIAITTDPTMTFTGQRMYEVVRPLLTLLPIDKTGLQNFEALMALTNLSSISDSVRERIVAERGLPNIEQYLYEEHEMIQRAAFECMSNMVMNEKVAKTFEAENDRVKLFVLMCTDEDLKIVKATAGALAILTCNSLTICKKIMEVTKWMEIITAVAVSDVTEIQHRGCYLLRNMIQSEKAIADKILEGPLLEVLMAISIMKEPERKPARELALECLRLAEEYKIIQKNPDK